MEWPSAQLTNAHSDSDVPTSTASVLYDWLQCCCPALSLPPSPVCLWLLSCLHGAVHTATHHARLRTRNQQSSADHIIESEGLQCRHIALDLGPLLPRHGWLVPRTDEITKQWPANVNQQQGGGQIKYKTNARSK